MIEKRLVRRAVFIIRQARFAVALAAAAANKIIFAFFTFAGYAFGILYKFVVPRRNLERFPVVGYVFKLVFVNAIKVARIQAAVAFDDKIKPAFAPHSAIFGRVARKHLNIVIYMPD